VKIDSPTFLTETTFISSSVVFSSGSQKFGNTDDDTHIFIGDISGSSRTTGSFGAGYIDNKLGIGTIVPTEKLHVVGELALEETSATSGKIRFRDTDQALLGTVGMPRTTNDIVAGSANNDMVFHLAYGGKFMWNQDSTNRMALTTTGLGIGTTSPATPFHIASGENATIAYINATHVSANGLLVRTQGTSDSGYAFKVQSANGSTEILYAGQGGSVGIGTSSPGAKLTVHGDISGSATSTGSFGKVKSAGGVFEGDGSRELIITDSSVISLSNNDGGSNNTIFGRYAGANGSIGERNAFFGDTVANDTLTTDADNNTGLGYRAMHLLTAGSENTAVGSAAG
jgi:hypothetical protein